MYAVLAAIGVVLGVVGTFLVPQRVFGGVEGLSVVLALVGNALVGSFGGLATRRPGGVMVPTVSWLLTVAVLAFVAPGGDVVIPGRLPADPGVVIVGPIFLIAGVLAAGLALVVTVRYAKSDYTERVNRPTQTA
jgi:hypothetical protein